MATPNAKGTGYARSLWEVDPAGERPAHRLTRSVEGEAGAEFAADRTLYFTSGRPAPGEEEKSSAPWALPAHGGEARVVLTRPGGVSSVSCASAADTVVLGALRLLGASTEAEHAELAKARKDAGVDAILHTGYPVRLWDHDLGPAKPELFVLAEGPDPDAPDEKDEGAEDTRAEQDDAEQIEQAGGIPEETAHHLRHLTGFEGSHGFGASARVAPDGTFVLVTVARAGAKADLCE